MSTEKKIVFGAENQTKGAVKDVVGGIIDIGKANSRNHKEFVSYLKEEIRLIEQKNSLSKSTTEKLFREAKAMAPGQEQQYKYGDAFEARKAYRYDKERDDATKKGLVTALERSKDEHRNRRVAWAKEVEDWISMNCPLLGHVNE